jgi:mRNA-degrading endonuclease RelE of RelBE toxin-antitoxin system
MTIIMVMKMKRSKYALIYAPLTKLHLKAIDRKYYSLIRTTIENYLQYEPDLETTNRKPLKRQVAFEAEWELRFGPGNRFRVFYDIDMAASEVHILAIGEKERDRFVIGGKEVKL